MRGPWGAGQDVSAGSSTDFGDILKDTDFGFLGHLEAEKGRYALFGDIIYLSVRPGTL